MGQTISNLVSKMLFSDQLMQRLDISQKLLIIIESSQYGTGSISDAIRDHFASRVKACAINPLAASRKTVCEIAKFYDTHAEAEHEISRAA